MSKPVLRIVLAVLISLGVILAIAANVPGQLGLNADSNSAGSSLFAGANEHTSVAGRVSLSARADTSSASASTQFESMNKRSGHECGSYSDSYADD